MRVLVIHNPASGQGLSGIHEFVRLAMHAGDEFVLRQTGSAADTRRMTEDAASFDVVVAAGGDGTVASIAYLIHETGVPLLAFPAGTANLFCTNLNNAEEPAAIAAMLREGRIATFDMGEISYLNTDGQEESQGFLLMAGAGYDASIIKGSEDLKATFGQFSYYLSALGNPHPASSELSITLDGGVQMTLEGICVLAGNWGALNPSTPLIPDTNPQDGLLDLAVITASHAVQLLPSVIGSLVTGQGVVDSQIKVCHARRVEVSANPPLPMQYDGDLIEGAQTPFTIQALPSSLKVFVDKLSPFYETASPLPW